MDRVEHLISHSNHLSQRLQMLLDKQWDALSVSGTPKHTRKLIESTMNELLDTQKELVECYDSELTIKREWLDKTKVIQDKIVRLQQEITSIESDSELAKEVHLLQTEQTEINDEIAKLEFRLKTLLSRKQEISKRLLYLKSTVESKSSSYHHELQSLKPPEDTEVEAYERQVDAIRDHVTSTEQEVQALSDGLVVWRDVCQEVGELEANLVSCLKASDPSRAKSMIEATIGRVQEKLDLATKYNWSLLVVAIGHELQALKRALELLKQNDTPTPTLPA
uniref:ARAD1B12562p n=1 Tax=Blastobotrys adeninivorans TaxID=409370 RepID=A0A060T6I9_BLAAD